jgi:hypothetical protein
MSITRKAILSSKAGEPVAGRDALGLGEHVHDRRQPRQREKTGQDALREGRDHRRRERFYVFGVMMHRHARHRDQVAGKVKTPHLVRAVREAGVAHHPAAQQHEGVLGRIAGARHHMAARHLQRPGFKLFEESELRDIELEPPGHAFGESTHFPTSNLPARLTP